MLTQRTLSIVNRYKEIKNLRQVGVEFNISHEAVRLHLVKYEKETKDLIPRNISQFPIWTCANCGKTKNEKTRHSPANKTKLCQNCIKINSPSIIYSNQIIETWITEINSNTTVFKIAMKNNLYSNDMLRIIFAYFKRNNQLDRAITFFHPRSVHWLKRVHNWPEFFTKRNC